MSKNNLSPSAGGLGLSMYRAESVKTTKAIKEARAKRSASTEAGASDLTSGILNGTEWSHDESVKVLRKFAKDEGLDVNSRTSKPDVIKALAKATAEQG